MRFTLISDVHIDVNPWDWSLLSNCDPNIPMVVAGDISNDVWEVSRWIVELGKRFPCVIWVAGNHDLYNLGFHQTRMYDPEFSAKWPYPKTVAEMVDHYRRWSAEHGGIYFLHRNSVSVDGVTFAGATGWHDYVAGEPYSTESQINAWYNVMNDRHIPWTQSGVVDHLSPMDAGIRDVQSLKAQVAASSEPVVVVTHHIPHRLLCYQRPHDVVWTQLHGSFANTAMEKIVDPKIKYWVYGHTHYRGITDVGEITYVCNARGYPKENSSWQPIEVEVVV